MDVKELDVKARQAAKDYKKLEQQLLSIIIKIDKNKIFYKLGFSSLFKYLTEGLELSPAAASAFTNVARKAQEVPELKNQVVSGKLSIYKAQRITSILTPQNSKTWLKLAANKTHRELEREVAIASPKNAIKEKSHYTSPLQEPKEKITIKRDIPRIELQLGVSERLMLKIRRAQDLESQRNKKNLNLEQTLEEVLSIYLEKRDPLRKAQRQSVKGELQINKNQKCRSVEKNRARAKNRQTFSTSNNYQKRQALPAKLRHQLQIRDKSQCAYIDSKGKRCSSRRYLEAHHIKPISRGGENSLKNLILLCSGHHKSIHSHKDF